ncbi:MAG TPA: serine hydrolase domain-containing protein [Rugosimonospora sp.]|nr:serine hydrolase domain-containing protein [Rugosimonospora sp.]
MTEPEWWRRVTAEMDAYHAEHAENLPGAAFGVETGRDGRLLGSTGGGWGTGTICEIGSMTKPFVAAAALLALAERGLDDIETPVHELPGMAAFAGDPVRRRIRLRHLLQHTSGLPHTRRYTEWVRTACNDPDGSPPGCTGAALDLGPTTEWIGAPSLTNECVYAGGRCQPARTLDLDTVSLHIMRTYPVTADPPPGTGYAYSTVNYVLVARIVEQLTGQSVNRYVKERLFAPLEMVDSFFVAGPTGDPAVDARIGEGVTDEQRARVAEFTLITKDGRFPPEIAGGPGGVRDRLRTGWRFVNADSGMYSTASDLLNFLGMLRDGGVYRSRRVLSPRLVGLLVDDQGHGHTMGFGYRDRLTPYGQRAGTLEHLGMKMTYFWYDRGPDDPVLGVFLSQRMPNFIANTNMSEGLRPIFRVFLPHVNAGVFAPASGV